MKKRIALLLAAAMLLCGMPVSAKDVQVTCAHCGGTGSVTYEDTCPDCGGTYSWTCSACGGEYQKTCAACHGAGSVTCPNCGGTGYDVENCAYCGNTRKRACHYCNGTGENESGGVCNECGGLKKEECIYCKCFCRGKAVHCYACVNGVVTCKQCDKGIQTCPRCTEGTVTVTEACPVCKGTGTVTEHKPNPFPFTRDISELRIGDIRTYTFLHLIGEKGVSCGRVVMTNTGGGICFTLSMEDPEDERAADAYFLLFPEGAEEGEKHLFGETVAAAEGTRFLPVVGDIAVFINAERTERYIALS